MAATQYVFEAKSKFAGLIEWAKRTNVGKLTSERSVARTIKTSYGTLSSALKSGMLNIALQNAIAEAFGFSPDWPEWRDPKAHRLSPATQRRDTTPAFSSRFNAHKEKPECLTAISELTIANFDHRFADFDFGAIEPPDSTIGTNQIPLALSISFGRRGLSFFLEDSADTVTVGLKEVELQLFFDRKTARVQASSVSCRGQDDGNFAGNVEGLRPWWVFTVTKRNAPWLAGRFARNDVRACICSGFEHGDKLRAHMTVRVNTCVSELKGTTFEAMSEDKKKFMRHLFKLTALNGVEATLCTQVLTVVRQP